MESPARAPGTDPLGRDGSIDDRLPPFPLHPGDVYRPDDAGAEVLILRIAHDADDFVCDAHRGDTSSERRSLPEKLARKAVVDDGDLRRRVGIAIAELTAGEHVQVRTRASARRDLEPSRAPATRACARWC